MNQFFVLFVLSIFLRPSIQTVWTNINFAWTSPSEWTWIRYGFPQTFSGTKVFTQYPGQMFLYYTPGELDAPIYTARSFGPGKKAFYVEWTANAQSCTNMELLSKQLMAQGQFASGNCWPNCGEFDVYEMLVRPQISSSYYGGPFNYGATTLHKGSKTSPCNCPAKGSSQNWYQNTQPMTSGCAAEWQNRPNAKNSLLTIFDEDSNGQFIQMIQDPVITQTGNTASFTMGPTSLATTKIYNNAQEFYGTFPPSSCPQGNPDPSTGWPFYNQEMHFILEEQSYTSQTGISGDTLGSYVVSSVKIFLGDFTGNVSSSTAGSASRSTSAPVTQSSTISRASTSPASSAAPASSTMSRATTSPSSSSSPSSSNAPSSSNSPSSSIPRPSTSPSLSTSPSSSASTSPSSSASTSPSLSTAPSSSAAPASSTMSRASTSPSPTAIPSSSQNIPSTVTRFSIPDVSSVPSGTVSGASSASGASSTISGASSASGGSQTVTTPTASDTGSTTGDLQLNTAAIAQISFSFVVMLLIACLL